MAIFSYTLGIINVASNTTKTLWCIDPGSNKDVRLRAWGVTFNHGNSDSAPILVETRRANDTITGSTGTPENMSSRDPSVSDVTFTYGAATEGSPSFRGGEIYYVNSAKGIHVRYLESEGPLIHGTASFGYYRCRVTTPASLPSTIQASFYVEWEE